MKNLCYEWKLSDGYPKANGLKVFGTFVCGGGSTMGYKLAGFDHLGGVEIDGKMAKIYRYNHHPKHFYHEDIRRFNERDDIPEELYNLDILDGSPPCTSFSLVGKREAGWGVERRYAEGSVRQTLDDLVYVYCDTIAKLRPKVAILENVPGLIAGRALGYAISIYERLTSAGYDVQIFLLNAGTMGVPQSRERLFYIARRRDLGFKPLSLSFTHDPIPFGRIVDRGCLTGPAKELWPSIKQRLPLVVEGERNLAYADARLRNLNTYNAFFSTNVIYDSVVPPALTSSGSSVYLAEQRGFNDTELKRMSSFPSDFDFLGYDARYVCGMSVPPLMIANLSAEIARQWFNIQ